MPEGKYKSGTFRKVFVKTPGGNTTVHYKNRKPSKAVCGGCGVALQGVPRERPYKMQNMPKTRKGHRDLLAVYCAVSACDVLSLLERQNKLLSPGSVWRQAVFIQEEI